MTFKTKRQQNISISAIMCFVMMLGISVTHSPVYTVQAQNAAADKTYTLLEPLPCIPGNGVTCQAGTIKSVKLDEYLAYAFNLIIALSAAAAVFMIVWGGFKYMTTDAWQGKSEGLQKVKGAIVGLLMVLVAYLILKTVNPKLVDIPTTIVEPIRMSGVKNETANFFNNLETQAIQYNANDVAARAARDKARADVALSQDKLKTILDRINTYGCTGSVDDDPQCETLGVQAQQIQNTITSTASTASAAEAQGIFNRILSDAATGANGNGTTAALIDTYIKKTNDVYAQALNTTSLDQKATLDNDYNNTIGNLRLQQYATEAKEAQVFNNTDTMKRDIANIQNIVGKSILPKITDPAQNAQLQQSMKTSVTQIQNYIDSVKYN